MGRGRVSHPLSVEVAPCEHPTRAGTIRIEGEKASFALLVAMAGESLRGVNWNSILHEWRKDAKTRPRMRHGLPFGWDRRNVFPCQRNAAGPQGGSVQTDALESPRVIR